MTEQRLTVLGATGSIGDHVLNIVRAQHERYKIYALSAHTQKEKLLKLCLEFQPTIAVLSHEHDAQWLKTALKNKQCKTTVGSGRCDLLAISAAKEADIIVAGIIGSAGLEATLAAAASGKRLLLANKEALVMSGALLMHTVQQAKTELIPIDSEHHAIFQCLTGKQSSEYAAIDHVILTASGGPFLTYPESHLATVTPEKACCHPVWSMGKKISIDSATMMNKGLEMIEARWLFSLNTKQIQVLLHPQSIIHAMVCFHDGSVLAQLSKPDMHIPIAYALAYPNRLTQTARTLNFLEHNQLTFAAVDYQRFPALSLATQILEKDSTRSAILLNAANEIAVAAFLKKEIRFTEITAIAAEVLAQDAGEEPRSIAEILHCNDLARERAEEVIRYRQHHTNVQKAKIA